MFARNIALVNLRNDPFANGVVELCPSYLQIYLTYTYTCLLQWKQWKQKGNSAFSAGKYKAAVQMYSKAINLNPKNATNYSNRSAAYLKAGDFEKALADASKCISLKPDDHKGYGRKGAAYHAMRKYDKAIAVYREGLMQCPDDEHLTKGLSAAKRAKVNHSGVSRARKKAEVVRKASLKKKRNVKQASTVSSFVRQRREELKLQMAAIKSQLEMLDELADMKDEEKLDLMFTLIDKDGSGYN